MTRRTPPLGLAVVAMAVSAGSAWGQAPDCTQPHSGIFGSTDVLTDRMECTRVDRVVLPTELQMPETGAYQWGGTFTAYQCQNSETQSEEVWHFVACTGSHVSHFGGGRDIQATGVGIAMIVPPGGAATLQTAHDLQVFFTDGSFTGFDMANEPASLQLGEGPVHAGCHARDILRHGARLAIDDPAQVDDVLADLAAATEATIAFADTTLTRPTGDGGELIARLEHCLGEYRAWAAN